jgi:hypothetical protein
MYRILILRKSAQKHLFPMQHVPTIIHFAFEAQCKLVAYATRVRGNMYNSLKVLYCVTRNSSVIFDATTWF